MLGGDSKVLRLDSGVYILSVQVIESKVAYAVGVTAPLLQFSNVIAVEIKDQRIAKNPVDALLSAVKQRPIGYQVQKTKLADHKESYQAI